MPVEIITDDKTLAEAGFYWRENEGVKVLVCKPIEDAGFTNGFSTRLAGESPFPENDLNLAGFDEDSADNIHENRRRFLSVFDGEFQLATAWQMHGDGVKTVRTLEGALRTDEHYDALVSDLSGVLTGVKTADCVPVLICDPVTGAFAAVHAGWKGTAAKIVKKTVETLIAEYHAETRNMFAAIGPSATAPNYEVGRDVMQAFADSFTDHQRYFVPTREGHALVDLRRANMDILTDSGVNRDNIFLAPFCTIERTDLFFSYRAEKRKYGKTGRLLSVIGQKPIEHVQ